MNNNSPTLGLEETFKLGVHLGVFGFGVACSLYNLGAFLAKKHPKNLANVLVYGGLVGFEVYQMNVHWRALNNRKDC